MENSVEIGVRSVRGFLEKVWQTPAQSDTAVTLFRGQVHDYPLLPRLFRPPNTVDVVQEHESAMLESIKKAAPHLLPSSPSNDWDWISLGQHYGMSTRMSDWTANPLVALFFAVELDSTKGSPLVYQYPVHLDHLEDKKNSSPLTVVHTRVMKVDPHSVRSEVQAAWQVVHAIHTEEDGTHHFYPLGAMPPHKERITEIKISPLHVRSIREELASWGITTSAIYADFASVCESIGRAYGLS